MSNNERSRILNLLRDGAITPEEAEQLLDALEGGRADETPAPEPVALKDTRGRKPKKLRILVDNAEKDNGKAKVNVSIPVSLIRTLGPIALSAIPKDTKRELEAKGINIAALIDQIEELIDRGMEEDFVDIDTGEGDTPSKVRIYVE